MNEFRAELDLPPAILSPNVKVHHMLKYQATKTYRKGCGWCFAAAKPKGWIPAPVEVAVEYRCLKKSVGYVARDIQNAIAALKAAIDGMVDAGVVPNDSKKWVTWGAFRLLTSKRQLGPRREGVTITVRKT